jgi:hypothetical protein
MGLGSPTRNYALGVPFQPMLHRQDADATKKRLTASLQTATALRILESVDGL